MANLPLPRRYRRLEIHCDRFHNDLDQPDSLSLTDHNLPLQCSRRDTPLPFIDIDLERPFVHRRMNPETSQTSDRITFD